MCLIRVRIFCIADSLNCRFQTSLPEAEAEEEGEDADGYKSPDLEGARKKVFCRSTLQWRSPALTQVMHTLDRKTARRRSAKGTHMVVERRNTGIISSRLAPDDAVSFALA